MALYLYISTCAGQSHVRLFSDCGIGHMIIWSLQSITFAHPLPLNHNQVDRDKDKALKLEDFPEKWSHKFLLQQSRQVELVGQEV